MPTSPPRSRKCRIENDESSPDIGEEYRELEQSLVGFTWPKFEEKKNVEQYLMEEMTIASFVHWMFKSEATATRFVDMGCGNGVLTAMLSRLGYSFGRGIDGDVHKKSKCWDQYPEDVQSRLQCETIDMERVQYADTDWIIANHGDELCPWVPSIAARSHSKFLIIPCCFWDFHGRFTDIDPSIGRFHTYVRFLESIAKQHNYQVTKYNISNNNIHYIAIKGIPN